MQSSWLILLRDRTRPTRGQMAYPRRGRNRWERNRTSARPPDGNLVGKQTDLAVRDPAVMGLDGAVALLWEQAELVRSRPNESEDAAGARNDEGL